MTAQELTQLTHPVSRANAPSPRERVNAAIIPISSDVRQCPTCQRWFGRAAPQQRYCCASHKVTGCKQRRKQLETAWVTLVTTMSAGRINAQRALDCIEWDAKRCEYVLGLWGYTFDGQDKLVRKAV